MSGTFAPAPGAAPLGGMVRAQAMMEARLLLRNGEQLVLALVIPLLTLLVGVVVADRTGVWSDGAVAVLAPGVLTLAVLSTSFTSLAIATGFERRYGVIKWLGSSPLPRHGLLLGKVGALLVVEAMQIACIMAVAAVLGWRAAPGIVGTAASVLAVVLGTLALASLGLLMAGALRPEATLAAANLVFILLVIAGGVVIAPAEYGELGAVLRLLPSGALHEAIAAGLHDASVAWGADAVLLAWAAVGALLTARTFRWE
jgi:ABC-2 type transport system permease protein